PLSPSSHRRSQRLCSRTRCPALAGPAALSLIGFHCQERKHLLMTPPRPITVSDASFANDVLNSPRPVLVDFWATWCGPCRAIAPVLEQLALDHGDKVTVAKLDVDANPLTSRRFQVASVPTLIVFKNGIPTTRLVGVRAKSALLHELRDYL